MLILSGTYKCPPMVDGLQKMRLKMEQEIPEYYLVDRRVLPEVFIKVMEVKQRLNTGESVSVNEAVRKTGLSRSAYYKYKDSVMPFYEATSGKKVGVDTPIPGDLVVHNHHNCRFSRQYPYDKPEHPDQRTG